MGRHPARRFALYSFDLEQFKKEEIPEPNETDIAIFKNILNTASTCNPGDFPGVLRDKLKNIPALKSNKNERTIIIEILACIGVLSPNSYNRATSSKHDWTFAEYWRGEDRYDADVAEKYFGKYL